MTLFLILSATVFVAAFVQGAIGIGFALIVAPVFGILAPEYLPVTLLILMLPLNFHVAWRERGDIDRPGAGWITLGRFFGTFAGLWMLAALSGSQLGLAVGWFTVIAAAVALLAPRFDPNRPAALGVGLFVCDVIYIVWLRRKRQAQARGIPGIPPLDSREPVAVPA